MADDEFTSKLQNLLDSMREEIEYNLSEKVEELEQEEQGIDKEELRQEKMLGELDPCDEAVVASEEYWELATQIQILSMFGEVPDDLREKARSLESRIKRLRENCDDDSKINKIRVNVKEAEKRLNNADKIDDEFNWSIEKLIDELEKHRQS